MLTVSDEVMVDHIENDGDIVQELVSDTIIDRVLDSVSFTESEKVSELDSLSRRVPVDDEVSE